MDIFISRDALISCLTPPFLLARYSRKIYWAFGVSIRKRIYTVVSIVNFCANIRSTRNLGIKFPLVIQSAKLPELESSYIRTISVPRSIITS